jgi:methylated-DNA-[protein]-cysteine S-methyltransferase
MENGATDTAALLRSHGLRSTPQRRAILGAFGNRSPEHLSADEVHERASRSMPDLGRGTVYATLAEFTEVGLLSSFGAPEPVRYETNTERHDHFRCRACLRVFDCDFELPSPRRRKPFVIDRVEVRAEGLCADCIDYDAGLSDSALAIRSTGAESWLDRRGVAASALDGPLGTLRLAASQHGLFRIAFEDHADAPALSALAASRRGGRAARGHLDQALADLRRYLSGEIEEINSEIDWNSVAEEHREPLRATRNIAYGERRSYLELGVEIPAKRLGASMGENPLPIVLPCHRVMRGAEMPRSFVGGQERRAWLLSHERHAV